MSNYWFGFIHKDYTEQFISSVVRTRYSKRQFTFVLELLLTQVLRSYIKILLDPFLSFHPVIDFISGIALSVVLIFNTDVIYQLVHKTWYEPLYQLSRYLINNYSAENFKRWKRNVVLVSSLILALHVYFAQITSSMILMQIAQFVISYIVVDIIDYLKMQDFQSWIHHLFSFTHSILANIIYVISSLIQINVCGIRITTDCIYHFIQEIYFDIFRLGKVDKEEDEEEDDEKEEEKTIYPRVRIIPQPKKTKLRRKVSSPNNISKNNLIEERNSVSKTWTRLNDVCVLSDNQNFSLVSFQDE
jgi:hypothetical protein